MLIVGDNTVAGDYRYMRKSAKWMVLLDDRIMEYIEESGPSLPSDISKDERIPFGDQHVGNRCRKLAKAGLLENLGNGVYILTSKGQSYLNEEYQVSGEKPADESDQTQAGGTA